MDKLKLESHQNYFPSCIINHQTVWSLHLSSLTSIHTTIWANIGYFLTETAIAPVLNLPYYNNMLNCSGVFLCRLKFPVSRRAADHPIKTNYPPSLQISLAGYQYNLSTSRCCDEFLQATYNGTSRVIFCVCKNAMLDINGKEDWVSTDFLKSVLIVQVDSQSQMLVNLLLYLTEYVLDTREGISTYH